MLADRVLALCAELLPAGSREGGYWQVGNLAGERGKSLKVSLQGPYAGNWRDWAGNERGDALDLVAQVRFGGDVKAALAWARSWLGQDSGAPAASVLRRAPEVGRGADAEDMVARRRWALNLFRRGTAPITCTPAAAYLEQERGIPLGDLGRVPRALRYLEACWCSEVGRDLPAMLAAVTDAAGQYMATHRTWIMRGPDGVWRKAPLREPRKTLGSMAGGFIPLWRGASDKPLREASAGETVAVAEGIETALSVALACPELRVLAAVSLGNMGRLILPPAVACVVLCADNDADPRACEAIRQAARAYAVQGRQVRVARAPVGKDFNDTLCAAEVTR
jgi:hypothetical protein